MNKFLLELGRSVSKTSFWTRQHSPEILIVGGIISMGAAIVFAVKSTTKVDSVLAPANKRIRVIKEQMNDELKISTGEYTLVTGRKELTKEYVKTGLQLAKLYAPTAISFAVAVAAMLGSHKIMRGRNFALAAAYKTIENGYKSYRERVKQKIGEKAERDIFGNVYDDEKKEIELDKNGKEKEVIKKTKNPHMNPNENFTYLFDSSNPEWSKSGRLNLDFLLLRERWINEKFIRKGHMFLYQVYEELGIDASIIGEEKLQASHYIGWIYDPEDTKRDNYISFGLADKEGNLYEHAMEMLRNNERNILLEFNPDGDILSGSNGKKTFMKYAVRE